MTGVQTCALPIYVRIEQAGEDLKVWYYFEDMEVGFSIQYHLTEDGFTVTVPFEDFIERIEEGRTAADRGTVSYWGVRSISILPYFGAAGLEDSGYMLIPDGSGALINFNNQKASYGAYSQNVYGRDPVLLLDKNCKKCADASVWRLISRPWFFGDSRSWRCKRSGKCIKLRDNHFV